MKHSYPSASNTEKRVVFQEHASLIITSRYRFAAPKKPWSGTGAV